LEGSDRMYLIEFRALRDLRSSYVPEDPAQAEFCASRNSVYIWSTVTVYIKDSSLNPNSNTLEPGWPQNVRSATYVIAQQYSSATFVSSRYLLLKGNILRGFKKLFNF
jgi:hypothetical protein